MGFNKFEIPITDEQLPETKESKTHEWHFTKDGKAQLTCSIKDGHLYNAAHEMKAALESILNIEHAAIVGGKCKALEGLDIEYHFNKVRAALAKAEGKSCNGDCLDCEELNSPNCLEGK